MNTHPEQLGFLQLPQLPAVAQTHGWLAHLRQTARICECECKTSIYPCQSVCKLATYQGYFPAFCAIPAGTGSSTF